jgi:protein prenyltransferase alpha subunit repeat containing protein 1
MSSGGEAIDWALEIGLCERCAERKNGNYHAWNHRQWVLQKATNLLSYEIIKTEKFIRKNIADYSAYHHRHFVLVKLFELQYFDIHDTNLNELYQFINYGLPEDSKIDNINDLVLKLLPNVSSSRQSINANKLNSFLYSLNLIIHDLSMMNELTQLCGKYESFNCYRRTIIKFGIDICHLVNTTDYLKSEHFIKTSSISHDKNAQPCLEIVNALVEQLDFSDENNVKFAKIFF